MRIFLAALAGTIFWISLAGSVPAWAQGEQAGAGDQYVHQMTAGEPKGPPGAQESDREATPSSLILAVMVLAWASLVVILWFLERAGTRDALTMISAAGLVLVVYGTILVVMVARADQQLTAGIGILGAVAGYLFGAATRRATHGTSEISRKPPRRRSRLAGIANKRGARTLLESRLPRASH